MTPDRAQQAAEAMRIWFVSPVYHDADSYRELLSRLNSVLDADERFAGLERVFVVLDDSAGTDLATGELAALPGVKVVTPPFNLGHQRGLVFALRKISSQVADTDLIVTLDADGEDRPEDVPRLLSRLVDPDSSPSELVIARRQERRHARIWFRLLYPFFQIAFRVLTGTWIQSGNFAAFRGLTTRTLLLHPSFDTCYSSSLIALDSPKEFVGCDRGARYAGESKMGYSKLALHGMRMLMPFTERIVRRALVLFLILLAVTSALAVAVLVARILTGNATPGWAFYSLLGLGFVVLLSLGNLLTLFTVFSHSRAISLGSLEGAPDAAKPERP